MDVGTVSFDFGKADNDDDDLDVDVDDGIEDESHLFILMQQMQRTAMKAPRKTRQAIVSTATFLAIIIIANCDHDHLNHHNHHNFEGTSTDPRPSASSGCASETSRTPRLVSGRGARRVNSS